MKASVKLVGLVLLCALMIHTAFTWFVILSHHDDHNNNGNPIRPESLSAHRDNPKQSDTGDKIMDDTSNYRAFDFGKAENNLALFYNIYVPKGSEASDNRGFINTDEEINNTKTHTATIFIQQIRQIGISQANKEGLTVYYNTIGQDDIVPKDNQGVCQRNKVDCVHMKHYNQGQEEYTLQNLQDYCTQFPDHRVIYIHAKGSYHNTHDNNENRITMTFSVLNKCPATLVETWINGTTKANVTCNVCGGMFMPIWGPFFSGNMWSAHCRYVQELVPPLVFRQRMEDLHSSLAQANQTASLQMNLFDNLGPYCLGTERYSNEHWVSSHPNLQPCDARGVRLGTPVAPHMPWMHQRWRMIPKANRERLQQEQHKALRMQEFFLLPGLLYRCLFLYQALPPAWSWAWSWFPDGAEWWEAAQTYKTKVVEVVTSRYAKQ